MAGINGAEFLVLIVIALVVIGPERLPHYAEQLARGVRSARRYAVAAKRQMAEELGPEAADVDWESLDPRRYDPRRIVREALLEDDEPGRGDPGRTGEKVPAAAGGLAATAAGAAAGAGTVAAGAPFDDEAT
ncbi:Sec-independent protein translocase family protein [Cellulomonas bogoriensis]|uniref:Translocase n=1 Tax=Cellulomonas bogoriensis 69B4 = DSM 16987 TaxID=1386082 RepID=A0A0A0C084_9CELL|nr:hypothetical protein [Cellulomonas bogoriensis]KGM13342.1 translocase [Cellulomonas bogoriensis 69B4 = DSM 16987]